MIISPKGPGEVSGENPDEGMSASPERKVRAKSIAFSLDLPRAHAGDLLSEGGCDTLAIDEQVEAVTEETRPLSPQFAALAKQKRELQRKEKELLAKQVELESSAADKKALEEFRARLKADALKVLKEEGVSCDQIVGQILASNESAGISGMKAEVQALKDELDRRNEALSRKDMEAEKQVLKQIWREADRLVSRGDDYELVREAGHVPKIVELIYRTFRKTGEFLDVPEAADRIEQELLEQGLRFAKLKKVQSRLDPDHAEQRQAVQRDRPGTKVMRTLKNSDGGSSLSLGKRERAIAAMEGRLK